MRLIEPLALLSGPEAVEACAAGYARALPFGLAYAFARLIDTGEVVSAAELPAPDAARLATPPAPWAGLPDRPLVMGIVNVTPDSFSDGGARLALADAVAAGRAMIAAGADILDIGGESTRPGSTPVPADEEIRRVVPVIAALAGAGAPISIDTRNAATMAAALDAGAAIVNDVSGLAHDPAAAGLVAARGVPVVLMHMRGEPATMNEHAQYADIAVEIVRELGERIEAAERAGIARANIAVDPGVGFAKLIEQTPEQMRRLPLLLNFGCRVLLGASRKGFIGRFGEAPNPLRRAPGSVAVALFGLARGASILRVHDVAETVQAVRVWQALSHL